MNKICFNSLLMYNTSDLIEILREHIDVNEEQVRREVAESSKQSFKILETQFPMIRANVGHSIDIVRQIKMEQVLAPIQSGVYHINSTKSWQRYKDCISKF